MPDLNLQLYEQHVKMFGCFNKKVKMFKNNRWRYGNPYF